jgi:dolichol-phosphate mannosyltransferase
MMGQAGNFSTLGRGVRAAWKPTIAVCLFLYAFALHYVVLGIPGIPYIGGFGEHYFWREATREVEQIVEEVQHQTGQKPLVVGMSRWSVASALSFYNMAEKPIGELMDIRSRNMFSESGAMYDFWYPSEPPTNRPIILVGMTSRQLAGDVAGNDYISSKLVQPGPIQERTIVQEDKPLRKIYYRVAQGYLGK